MADVVRHWARRVLMLMPSCKLHSCRRVLYASLELSPGTCQSPPPDRLLACAIALCTLQQPSIYFVSPHA
jgi:hypothetical protein